VLTSALYGGAAAISLTTPVLVHQDVTDPRVCGGVQVRVLRCRSACTVPPRFAVSSRNNRLVLLSHVDETAVVALEGDRDSRGRSVTVLGDNEVGFAGAR